MTQQVRVKAPRAWADRIHRRDTFAFDFNCGCGNPLCQYPSLTRSAPLCHRACQGDGAVLVAMEMALLLLPMCPVVMPTEPGEEENGGVCCKRWKGDSSLQRTFFFSSFFFWGEKVVLSGELGFLLMSALHWLCVFSTLSGKSRNCFVDSVSCVELAV